MEGATAHDFHNPQRMSHERSACRPFSARPRMAASQSGRIPASPPLRTAEHLAASTASTSPSSIRNPCELHGRAFREGSERRSLMTTYCPTATPEGAPISILRSRVALPRPLPQHLETPPAPSAETSPRSCACCSPRKSPAAPPPPGGCAARSPGSPPGKTFASWRPEESSVSEPTQNALITLEWIGPAENLVVARPDRLRGPSPGSAAAT
jgi:hypothetical protein